MKRDVMLLQINITHKT